MSYGDWTRNYQLSGVAKSMKALVTQARASASAAEESAETVSAALAAMLPQNLLQWAYSGAYRPTSNPIPLDANGVVTTANIVWPDGATGVYVTDATTDDGAINAWHATYVNGTVSKTITQPAVTRDADGVVIYQPEITIS
jgi:hypothetical protein